MERRSIALYPVIDICESKDTATYGNFAKVFVQIFGILDIILIIIGQDCWRVNTATISCVLVVGLVLVPVRQN